MSTLNNFESAMQLVMTEAKTLIEREDELLSKIDNLETDNDRLLSDLKDERNKNIGIKLSASDLHKTAQKMVEAVRNNQYASAAEKKAAEAVALVLGEISST